MPLKLLYLLWIKSSSHFDISQFCFFLCFFPLLISAGVLGHLAVEKEVTRAEAFQTLFTKCLISPLLPNLKKNIDMYMFTYAHDTHQLNNKLNRTSRRKA